MKQQPSQSVLIAKKYPIFHLKTLKKSTVLCFRQYKLYRRRRRREKPGVGERGDSPTGNHEFNSADPPTSTLESPFLERRHSFVHNHYSRRGKSSQVKKKKKLSTVWQWMDNKTRKPIIASRGWPRRMEHGGQGVCVEVIVREAVCSYDEITNNDLHVNKVHHLFDELGCFEKELQAFVNNFWRQVFKGPMKINVNPFPFYCC